MTREEKIKAALQRIAELKLLIKYWKEPYSTDKQLGCYVEMLKVNKDIVPDVCNTIWAYPDVCIFGTDQPVGRCTDAWNKAWEKFQSKQEQF